MLQALARCTSTLSLRLITCHPLIHHTSIWTIPTIMSAIAIGICLLHNKTDYCTKLFCVHKQIIAQTPSCLQLSLVVPGDPGCFPDDPWIPGSWCSVVVVSLVASDPFGPWLSLAFPGGYVSSRVVQYSVIAQNIFCAIRFRVLLFSFRSAGSAPPSYSSLSVAMPPRYEDITE